MHNGNDEEVNESEPIIEELKKEVKVYCFIDSLDSNNSLLFFQDKVSDKIAEDSTLAPKIIAE